VLYVGKSKDLRARVRNYFTASETRSRIGEMVRIAESVEGLPCSTALEAEVRELRLIAEHKPTYNRRSRHPERVVWLKLTDEPWPRLSLVRRVLDDDAIYLGPFGSRRTAERAMAALHEAYPLRQCSGRLPRQPSRTPCVLAEMGRCLSPCDGSASPEAYDAVVAQVRHALIADPQGVVDAVTRRMERLAGQERYEDAGMHRDRLGAFLRGSARTQRLAAVTGCRELVAARGLDNGRWEMHVVRHGRLAAAGVLRPGESGRQFAAGLVASAETVTAGPGPTPAASAAETECVLRWLESSGIRLVDIDGTWTCPLGGAGRHVATLVAAEAGRDSVIPFDERRMLSTVHQP
jgi:DNA polymerase III subunit epsilon